ncbi:MAG: hypothetical protein F4000_09325 [Holophagales bacterium]|nr:hypothetical protein [Holophagales bacterium]
MTGTETEYVSAASQALLRVVDELSRRPLDPVPLADLVESMGESRDRVFRSLKNLEAADWVEQCPGGWRLAPAIVQVSERMRVAIAEAHRRYLT